ncbi:hypothetical protein HY492_00935, partial [Candidatus Woesearchaeota archaeon]|nr:hypothetical protein [Candidatus Woesearchaeota archaeon]
MMLVAANRYPFHPVVARAHLGVNRGNMRTFILRARKSVTKPFDIDDLPAAGNMQVVASCIGNALWVSNNVRQDT